MTRSSRYVVALILGLHVIGSWAFGLTNIEVLVARSASTPVHHTGHGTASVTVEDELGKREYVCDFSFDEKSSRSTRYHVDAQKHETRGSVTWLVASENIVVNKQRVVRHIKPPLEFHRQLGYDFHPTTFLSPFPTRMKMAEYLSHLQKHGGRVIDSDDPNTPILLVGEPTTTLALDRNTGLLQRFVHDLLNREEGKGFKKTTNYTWKKWGNAYYLQTLEQSTEAFTKLTSGTELKPTIRTVKIEVRTFTPLTLVDVKAFTLEGLGIAEGMPMWDEPTRVTSRYRSHSD